ncbi:MAG: hypothetical protein KUG81_02610 [Gammaproteobacteria bacterium]|nr:hypothetical protein [Gammaproteobacteria bacterium]
MKLPHNDKDKIRTSFKRYGDLSDEHHNIDTYIMKKLKYIVTTVLLSAMFYRFFINIYAIIPITLIASLTFFIYKANQKCRVIEAERDEILSIFLSKYRVSLAGFGTNFINHAHPKKYVQTIYAEKIKYLDIWDDSSYE